MKQQPENKAQAAPEVKKLNTGFGDPEPDKPVNLEVIEGGNDHEDDSA